MTREEFIKEQISKQGFNFKSFANHIGMPYSTLLSIINGSIGGAAVDNVIKICHGLNMTINDLQKVTFSTNIAPSLTEKQISVAIAYAAHPEVQHSVDLLLGIAEHKDNVTKLDTENEDGSVTVWAAARSTDDHEPGYRRIDKEAIERLKKAKPKNSESEF